MGITKEFLLNQMSRLELSYGKEKFIVSQEMFDLWYEMFSDCEEEGLRLSIDKCIKESEFPPNIAGVMKQYKELDQERKELGDLIRHQYVTIRSIWGEEYDKETHDAIIAYIFRFPKKLRRVEMVELTHRAVSFVHDCEVTGRKDKPKIKEYLEGAR